MKLINIDYPSNKYIIIDLEKPYYPVLALYGHPSRRSFKDRTYELPFSIAVTNHFHLPSGLAYTWFIDIDTRYPRELEKYAILITKTMKGFHVYLDVLAPSFKKAMKYAYRWHKTYGDKGQLKMALLRKPPMLLIRIAGKYTTPIEVIYERHACCWELEEWKRNVIFLINYLNQY